MMRNFAAPFCAVCRQEIRNKLAAYVFPGEVSGTPDVSRLQGFGRGTLHLVTPMRNGGLGHYWRDNSAPGVPWMGPFVFALDVGMFEAVALIANGLELEIIARAGGQLLRYVRDIGNPFQWHGPTTVGNQIVTGNIALITGIYNLGVLLTNELIVPLASGGLAHYWRDVRSPVVSWNGPFFIAAELGLVDAVAIVQSSFGDPDNANMPTNLEVIVRVGQNLFHYWREAGPLFTWHGPFPVGASGVSGNPVLVQGPFGTWKKNFEMVVPLASGGMAHYWRENDAPGLPWHGPFVFGTNIGNFDALAMLVETYTTSPVPPFTIQVIARFQGKLLFYYRDAGAAKRWTLL